MLNMSKAISVLADELNEKIEERLLSSTRLIMKAKYKDDRTVAVVGLGFKNNYYYMKGPVDTSYPKDRGIYRARDIMKENLFTQLGPVPVFPPNRVVLVPFPSLVLAGLKEVRSISKEWSGVTFSCDLPYIEYTILN